MNNPIPVTRSSMPKMKEYIKEIQDLWDSHWLTNMGGKHKKLELDLEKYLGVPNLILFTNGHLALESAIEAFDLSGEVITTPFTFVSTTHAIVRKGLQPVFCDIGPDNYTMDVNKIESLITKKTSAIIPVHVYGNLCDIDEIDRIANKYNLKVIYDAAHAFGVTINGTGIGNFGDASVFSFHATKVFHTIEGGAITFKDDVLREKLNHLKNFGITGPENVKSVGGNAKMNEFQAAMGLCNLRHLDKEVAKREIVFKRYLEKLSGIKGIKLPMTEKGIVNNYSYFPVLFTDYRLNRDDIYELLKTKNIFTRKYFYPLTNNLECYKSRFNPDATPVAKYIAERILTFPLYADLPLDDVNRICRIIKAQESNK